MACSSGEATVSAIVFGFAPGYVARTTIVGGTTSGYSLIGSFHIAIKPTMKMTIESTPAKIGRRIKKCEKFIDYSSFAIRHSSFAIFQRLAPCCLKSLVRRARDGFLRHH